MIQRKAETHHGTIIRAEHSRAEFAMSDNTRTMLIALGVALVVVILAPALFMSGMMGTMMNRGVMGSGAWVMLALVLAVLVAGGALLVTGLRRR
jgi:hypothetical protein